MTRHRNFRSRRSHNNLRRRFRDPRRHRSESRAVGARVLTATRRCQAHEFPRIPQLCPVASGVISGAITGADAGRTRMTIDAMTSSHGPHDNKGTSGIGPTPPSDVTFVLSTPRSDLTRRCPVSHAIDHRVTDPPCRSGQESTIRSDPCCRSVHGTAKRVSGDFTAIVKRSRKAQGLPDHVSDPDTLRRIAQILQPGTACPAAAQRSRRPR